MTRPERYKTPLTVNATVLYDVLPETPEFPEQVDILRVVVRVNNRNINIIRALDESSLLALEDEIAEAINLNGGSSD